MIVPTPPVELEGHCSVIYNNSLYTYSANGFTSIPLELNGTWSQLPMGEPVSNAACVTGGLDGSKDQQAMYVIGGVSSSSNPPGVQRYSFKDRTWTTIQSTQSNMGNRTAHSAVYLNSSSSILVYGGNTVDGSLASSDTFTINTTSPYAVLSYNGAEPAISPVLLPWTDSEAALVGGLTYSKEIHLFNPVGDNNWRALGVNLSQPLSSDVKCAIVSRSDGSKFLESFNMNVSPNNVTTVALLNAGGTPANTSTIVGAASPSRKRKRETTQDGYPTYDGQLASSTTRSDYSLAQADDGLVVISSGSGTGSLAIFNQTSNNWVNATKLFYGNESLQQILASTVTPSPSSSSTPTSTPASSASSGNNNVGVIIGATVGSLVGLATIVILLLSFLHHKKQRNRRAGPGTGGGSTNKDRLSFQDQGMGVPLAQSAYPMAKSPVPLRMPADSVGIFSGEKALRSASDFPSYGQNPTQLKSPDSEFNVLSDKEIEAQVSTMGGQPGDRRTDEGWGKYFQDNNTRSLVGMQSEANTSSRSQSEAKNNAWPMNTLAPLNFGFLDEPKPLGGRVVSGSPTTENGSAGGQNLTRAESLSARISSISAASEESDYDHDPNSQAAAQHSWLGRPPSSTYSKTYSNNRDTMNTRGSSILILDNLEPSQAARNNVNSDMSWLNLNADR